MNFNEDTDKLQEEMLEVIRRIDPIRNHVQGALTDAETLDDFKEYLPFTFWCPETLKVVSLSHRDNYEEIDDQDYITNLLLLFNKTKKEWAESVRLAALQEQDTITVKRAEEFIKYVKRSLSASNVRAVAGLWRANRTIHVSEMNKDPYLMGSPAGVIDIRQGETRYVQESIFNYEEKKEEIRTEGFHEAETIDVYQKSKYDLITKSTRGELELRSDQDFYEDRHVYDKRWDVFIDEITSHNADKAAYLQRALGYSIFGGNPEECMFVAYGLTTRNGKGTLLNSVVHALGDYAKAASSDLLIERTYSTQGDKDELAMLEGIRLLTISEPPEGKRLDEVRVKNLTGNDPITTSKKYGHTFTYHPQFTIWMSCNSLPKVKDTTVFTSGRIRVITFDKHFDEDTQDKTLKDRFMSETGMTTIMEWLMKGYKDYLAQGLNEPECVREATRAWHLSSGDSFKLFLDTECEFVPDERVKVKDFREKYQAFCEEAGLDNIGIREINIRLKEMGIKKFMGHDEQIYQGLRFI